MKRRLGWPVLAAGSALALMFAGCSGPQRLTLTTFSATGAAGGLTTFSWRASSTTGDTLTCSLDTNDDGVNDVTIPDCGNTATTTFTYPNPGTYTAKLQVTDQHGNNVNRSVDVIASWLSTTAPTWVVQFGGAGNDQVSGVAVDPSEASYVSGYSNGPLGGTTSNASTYDAYLARIDSHGSLSWVKRLATSGYDKGNAVAADANGNGYITGYTDSVLGTASLGQTDAFLAKYRSDGSQVWLRQFGSGGPDYALAVAVDTSGNSYVAGYTLGDIAGIIGGLSDAFLVKYDANGNQTWARQFGSTQGDWAHGVAVDTNGNVYVAGYTAGDFGTTTNGGNDAFLAKFDSNGNQIWVRQFGSTGDDDLEAVAVGADGTVAVAGETTGDVAGPNQGFNDIIVATFDGTGHRTWLHQFGTIGSEDGYGVAIDAMGNVIVTGETDGSLGGAANGNGDIYLAKYDRDGTQVWLRQIGTGSYDLAFGVATDIGGNLFLGADTAGYLDTFTSGSNQGPADPLVVKYLP